MVWFERISGQDSDIGRPARKTHTLRLRKQEFFEKIPILGLRTSIVLVIPLFAMSIAVRWCSEMGRPLGRFKKLVLYGVFPLCTGLMMYTAPGIGDDSLFLAVVSLQVMPVVLMFVVSFWGEQDDRRLLSNCRVMVYSLFKAGLIAFVLFLPFGFLVLGRSLSTMLSVGPKTPSVTVVVFLAVIWPLLFLAEIPRMEELPEEEDRGETWWSQVMRWLFWGGAVFAMGLSVYSSMLVFQEVHIACATLIAYTSGGMFLLLILLVRETYFQPKESRFLDPLIWQILPSAMLAVLLLAMISLWRSFFDFTKEGNGVRELVLMIWSFFACLLILWRRRSLFRTLLLSFGALLLAFHLYVPLGERIEKQLFGPWIESSLRNSYTGDLPGNQIEADVYLGQIRPYDDKFCSFLNIYMHQKSRRPDQSDRYQPIIEACKRAFPKKFW